MGICADTRSRKNLHEECRGQANIPRGQHRATVIEALNFAIGGLFMKRLVPTLLLGIFAFLGGYATSALN